VSQRITLPVKIFQNERWAELSVHAPSSSHDICAEKVNKRDEQFSFIGGHRVRLYAFKKNVHWRIPAGVTLDISAVPAALAPRRGGR
jgi:hypothetical protein